MKCMRCIEAKYVKKDRLAQKEIVSKHGLCLYCKVMRVCMPVKANDRHYCVKALGKSRYKAENCTDEGKYVEALDKWAEYYQRALALHRQKMRTKTGL